MVGFDADVEAVRQTVRTSGINGIALTKLDVLDGLDEIKVCVGYKLDGQEIDYLPASQGAQARVGAFQHALRGALEQRLVNRVVAATRGGEKRT